MRRFMAWCADHPVSVLVILLAGTLLAAPGFRNLRISTSSKKLSMKGDPRQLFYDQTVEAFGSDSSSTILVSDPQLFTPAKLQAFSDLSHKLTSLEGSQRVQSLCTIPDFVNRDGFLESQLLLESPPASDVEATRLRQRALTIPFVKNAFLSEDGHTTLINVRFGWEESGEDAMRRIYQDTEEVLAAFRGDFETLFQIGLPMLIEHQRRYISRDQTLLVPLAVGVLIFMLWISTGQLQGAVLPLLTSAVSVIWTIGFMGWFQIPITVLTFMVPALIIVIGSTEDVHLVAEHMTQLHGNRSPRSAVRRMIVRMGLPVLFTALTTFAGFLSLRIHSVQAIREFSLVASFGLFVNPLVTMMIAPAFLQRCGRRSAAAMANPPGLHYFGKLALPVLEQLCRRPGLTIPAIILPCAAIAYFGFSNLEADNNIIGYFKSSSEVRQRADVLEHAVGGSDSFQIRINSGAAGTFKEPKYLRRLILIQNYLTTQRWVDHTLSIADYIQHMHNALEPDSGAFPATRPGVAEYLLFLHHDEIAPLVTSDFSQAAIILQHHEHSSRQLSTYVADLEDYLDTVFPPEFNAEATGQLLMTNRAVASIVDGQLKGLAILIVVVTLLLSLFFRDIRAGLIALVPNLIPIGVMFGFMTVVAIPLNIATSMVAAVTLGISVDDTIHLMMRYRMAPPSMNNREAAVSALRHELVPVTATSLSLALCFATLQLSSFAPISDFGLLAAVVMLAAFVADLTVTPALLTIPGLAPARRPGNLFSHS